jgi:hypothetical protein
LGKLDMPSAKRLIRQEGRESCNYFRDLFRDKKYDDASEYLLTHPEITKSLSKRELRVMLDAYISDCLSVLKEFSGSMGSALEKSVKNINKEVISAR